MLDSLELLAFTIVSRPWILERTPIATREDREAGLQPAHPTAEVRRAQQDGKPQAFVKKLEELRFLWKEWVLEFIADMIAAYLAGPAYGWANVRLCMNIAVDVFEPNASHPADDSRATAIELVLETLGCQSEKSRIEQMWSDFVVLTGRTKPGEFDIAFPGQLLERLRSFVVGECRSLGLNPWVQSPASSGAVHITSLLGQAWDQFNRDPGGFAVWEAERIRELKEEFGA